MQHRHQLRRIDAEFVDQQRAQLRVAVLLDDEHALVRGDEFPHAVGERERAHAQRVEHACRRAPSASIASAIAGLVEP